MKKVQVIWSDESLNDLEVIYDFIAEQSSKSAKKSFNLFYQELAS